MTKFVSPLLLPVMLATVLSVAASGRAQGGEWSRFRGPNGTGIATTAALPVEFGPDKNVVWNTPLPAGISSPVLWRDRIYLTAERDEKLLTLCLDRATGEILWQRAAPRDRVSKLDQRNHAAAASAAVDEDTVVVFFNDYGMVAYDHTGDERWRLPLGPFDNIYGMGASPVLVGERVFLVCDQTNDSFLIAVGKIKGNVAWRVRRPMARSGHCTPIVYQPDEGAPQLVVPGSFLLDAYDTAKGERVWWVGGLSFEMKSVPALHDGTIYINGFGSPLNNPGNQIAMPPFEDVVAQRDANGDGAIQEDEMPQDRARMFFEFCDLDGNGALGSEDWTYLRAALASKNGLLAIRAGGRGDMTEESVAWTYHRSIPQLPSTLVYDGVVYLLNDQGGLLTTLRAKDGEVIERGRLSAAIDNYYASPVAGDDKIYMVSENGLVSVLPAGGGLAPLATNDLDELCYATPAIADGRIYLRTATGLYCFGVDED